MENTAGFGAHAEQQIVILAQIHFAAESADRLGKTALEYHEMADVIFGQNQIGRPVGLEERVKSPANLIHVIFIRVEEIRSRGLLKSLHHMKQGVRRQHRSE